ATLRSEKEVVMKLSDFLAMRVGAFAVVLILASGCQGPRASTPRPSILPAEPTAPLSKAQRADVKVTVARSLEKAGDIDRAIALYTEAAAADPKRLDACLRLAALDELQGRLKESREWYRKALALQPDNADVYCDLGYSLYLQGEWTESSKQLQRALRLAPD